MNIGELRSAIEEIFQRAECTPARHCCLTVASDGHSYNCCAVGALFVKMYDGLPASLIAPYTGHTEVVEEYGMTFAQLYALAFGFDGHNPTNRYSDSDQFYRLGQELREKFLN